MANELLVRARREKNGEFYTQLSDIEKELCYYKDHFKGKAVLCNCDDPRVSEFFNYFALNFAHLGLKKLITTCYKNQTPDLFSRHDCERAVYLEYTGCRSRYDNVPTAKDIGIKKLKGDGDFRSAECVELLKQADIVVTNPPFSLFREYVAQLIKYDKKFIIIGPKNAITYKEMFGLIKENKVWLGYRNINSDMWFVLPEDSEDAEKIENGKKLKHINACWFTNLDIEKRHKNLICYRNYTPERYPTYDNYNAINVDKVADIPHDYDGIMGVPITFLDKYCPEQFEILDINPHFFTLVERGLPKLKQLTLKNAGKKDPYARILIRRRPSDPNRPYPIGAE